MPPPCLAQLGPPWQTAKSAPTKGHPKDDKHGGGIHNISPAMLQTIGAIYVQTSNATFNARVLMSGFHTVYFLTPTVSPGRRVSVS